MKKTLALISAIVAVALIAACSNNVGEPRPVPRSLSITWSLGGERTILPADRPVIATHDVSVVSATGSPYSWAQNGITSASFIVYDVPDDSVVVTVVGRDAEGRAIASSTDTVNIDGNGYGQLACELSYLAAGGTGSMAVTVRFDPAIVPPSSFSATLTDPAGTVTTPALSGSGRLWTLSVNPAAVGSWRFHATAATGSGTAMIDESIVVLPTLRTDGEIFVSLADFATAPIAGIVSDFAGNVASGLDGVGAGARFLYPEYCAFDGTYAYVSDTYAHAIRRVNVATGTVITIAGSPGVPGSDDGTGAGARFRSPKGIAFMDGDLYVADSGNNTVRKLVLSGAEATVTTIAGSPGASGSLTSNYGIVATSARFTNPTGIACDPVLKNIYVSDTGSNKIAAINVSISPPQAALMAGRNVSGNTDSTDGLLATFSAPTGIIYLGDSVYVCSGNAIRRIGPGGVTTFAGSSTQGVSNGTGTAATFWGPSGLATDGTYLYVSEGLNGCIRKIDLSTAEVSFLTVDPQVAPESELVYPRGIALSGGTLVVCEPDFARVRTVSAATGAASSLAGSIPWGSVDGAASGARFNNPSSLAVDGTWLYVGDLAEIRRVSLQTGAVETVAGNDLEGAVIDGSASSARFEWTGPMATDGTSLFVADGEWYEVIRKVDLATKTVTTLAGSRGEHAVIDGFGPDVRFDSVLGIAVLGDYLFVTDGGAIRKVSIATGETTTLVGTENGQTPVDGNASVARFKSPRGIVAVGNALYVADLTAIRKVDAVTGAVMTLAGSTTSGTSDGTGTAARFRQLSALASDGKCLYVIEASAKVRKIVIQTKAVTTLAGGGTGHTNATGTSASFNVLEGIAADGSRLYLADCGNYVIRAVD